MNQGCRPRKLHENECHTQKIPVRKAAALTRCMRFPVATHHLQRHRGGRRPHHRRRRLAPCPDQLWAGPGHRSALRRRGHRPPTPPIAASRSTARPRRTAHTPDPSPNAETPAGASDRGYSPLTCSHSIRPRSQGEPAPCAVRLHQDNEGAAAVVEGVTNSTSVANSGARPSERL